MSKKEALEQFHKDNIANIAENLYLAKGVDKTTMDEIAKEADYSKSTLYVYFKNKNEITCYLVLRSLKGLYAKFKEIVSKEESVLSKYKEICNNLINFYEEFPFEFEKMIDTIASDQKSREGSKILEDIYCIGEDLNSLIEKLISDGIQEGVIEDKINRPMTGFIYWSLISGIIVFASKKASYIKQRYNVEKSQFLEYSFELIIKAIKK